MDRIWSSSENTQRKILGSAASSSRTAYESFAVPHLKQINDSLYEVHTPEGRLEVEILFFHGLQLEGSRDGHVNTWLSGDGSEFWLNWIPADISGARVLTISYGGHSTRTTESGGLDVYTTGENILYDMFHANIGQSGCPVVLVGHSFGGLIIKQLCVQAESQLNGSRERETLVKFLNNLVGCFFYATPHLGSWLNDFSRGISKGTSVDHVTILDTRAARLNQNFRDLRKKYGWKTFGIGESRPVKLGAYIGLIVEEASARLDVDGFYTVEGDHFTVCQPRFKLSRNYLLLVDFVNQLLQEDKAEHSPKTDFPNEFVGLEGQTMAVREKVHVNQRLWLHGVQGIGKTMLKRAIIGSEGSIGHPPLEGISFQTQEIYHSVHPASPHHQGWSKGLTVPEALSRYGDFNIAGGVDHISIARPGNTSTRSFTAIEGLLNDITKDPKEGNERATASTIEILPLPFIQDPKYVEFKRTLIKVKEALESKTPGRVITLSGASGDGKTSMAKHLALYYQNAGRRSLDGVQAEERGTQNLASRRFRDGVIFLTCSSREVIISPLLELWKKLGYELLPLIEAIPGNASSSSGIQESSISESRLLKELTRKMEAQNILIILDDVHYSTLIERFIRIPGESLKFLITTQNPGIWGDRTCKQIPIGTPTTEEACHILRNHVYGRHKDITQPIKTAIKAIVEKAACHPLVLANFAANIRCERDNDLEEWENARRYFDELVFDATNTTAFLYDEMYTRTVNSSIRMTLSSLSKGAKSLLLLASIFESQSTPEVVFKLFAKRRQGRLARFSRWSKLLQDTNFIRVDFTADSWTTGFEITWFLHPLRQRFIERIEESEVKSMVEGVLERKTDDDDIAFIVLLIVYGQDKWRKQAAKALAIPTPQFQIASVQSWSLHLAAVNSFVGLIHVDPRKESEYKSDRLAKQILQKYIYCQELDDESVSILLSATETYTPTLKALSIFSLLNSDRIFLWKTMSAVVNLLEPENSTTLATCALLLISRDDENKKMLGQLPYAMETLVGLLADNVNEATQQNAAHVLASLAVDAENRRKIGQLPNAMERLVALLADNVSEATNQGATLAILNLTVDAENRRKIGQLPNAMERLVALLADNVSEGTRVDASAALANLARDAENRRKIGQLPYAMLKLVALLADNVSEGTREDASAALANLALDAENRRKIGQLPTAMERLLADNVSEVTREDASVALANLALDAENQKKIGQLPNAMETLVALLADNVSEATNQRATVALTNLALDAENQRKIGQLPNAMERLVALLANNVSEATNQRATVAITNLALDAENRRKIGQLPNAMERLVALLADNVSEGTREDANAALANLALDAENRRKIGQLLNDTGRLVALLADNVPQDAEDGMARSREDIEKQTHQDQEGAQEETKEPTIMDEDHDSTPNKAIFVAEEDAKTLNVIDEDNESNSGAGTPRNHVGHGKQHEVVKDFIKNINRGKSAYVVSKAWLFRLEEHYKETVISVLRRAGYVEFYQTRTTIIYRRIENSASHVEASDFLDSEMSPVTSFEKKFQLGTVRSDDSSRLGSPRSLLDKGMTALTSSNEKVESFKTALKDTGPYGYFVSTQWLSTLRDHEVGDLNVALSKAGYSQVGKTSTATYFKRHDRVYNNPESRSEAPSTSVRTILYDQGRPSISQGTEFSLQAKLQDFNMDDTKVTSKIQERKRKEEDCECAPQDLTMSCSSSFEVQASPSSSQRFSKHFTIQPVGDCVVIMPKNLKQRTINARAEKSIEMKTIDFDDRAKSYLKTYMLAVSAETSLSCCLMNDEKDKKVRFEFLKIQGAVKMKVKTGLVLRALRTNVVAYITKVEPSECSKHVPLCLWSGELERLQSVDDQVHTRTPVWLKISGKDPKDSDPGSTTLELQRFEAYCTDTDPNHELLFSNYGPRVVFEGDLRTDYDQNSLLELNVRYQLEICDYDCDSLPQCDNFVDVDRKIENVDFDCILEYSVGESRREFPS